MVLTDRGFKNLLYYDPFCVKYINNLMRRIGKNQVESVTYNPCEVIGDGASIKGEEGPKDVDFDIYVTTNTGENIILEVQQEKEPDLLERFQYYLIQCAANKIKRSKAYVPDGQYKLICTHKCRLFPTNRMWLHFKESCEDPSLSASGFEKFFFRPSWKVTLPLSDPLCFWNYIPFRPKRPNFLLENEFRKDDIYKAILHELDRFQGDRRHHYQKQFSESVRMRKNLGMSWETIGDTLGLNPIALKSMQDQVEPPWPSINNVVGIENAQKEPSNGSCNSTNHEYEISFIPDTAVYPCLQDTSDIPTLQFNFCKIADIENMAVDSLVDIIGVVKTYGDLQTFTAKSIGKLIKRELTIVDTSCKEIALTLWGKAAESFNDDSQPVVAVKGAKVGEYQGKNLSLLGSSTLQINPDLPECHQLRGWFDNELSKAITESFSNGGGGANGNRGSVPWKLLIQANEVTTTDMEKGDYFMSKVSLIAIKRDNAMYMACETPSCNKKVIDQGNGTYRCEKCQKDMPGYKWRLKIQCTFADFTGEVSATAFHEAAEKIFGKSGEELGEMYKDRSAEFDELVKEIAFQDFIVKFRSRMEMYNNETRKKFTVLELRKINHA